MIIILCRSGLGRAQKEKRPLSRRNVLEQMRTLTWKRTRGFGQMQWMTLFGALCTVVHCVHCVKAPAQWQEELALKSRALHSPCHAEERASYKGTFLHLGMYSLQRQQLPRECPSHICIKPPPHHHHTHQAPWPGAYPCWLGTGVVEWGVVRVEISLTRRLVRQCSPGMGNKGDQS